jgi:maltooligosyltrehalose trehalohydrolase
LKKIGAYIKKEGGCCFSVWAPFKEDVSVNIIAPEEKSVHMNRDDRGYWFAEAKNALPGTRYVFEIEKKMARPDPASHFQPEGVHGPSEVVDHEAFLWEDSNWQGVVRDELVLYEIHTGTFTPQGSFEAIIPRLGVLKELGVTAIEIMPVAQFPGGRNWGYDGVYPYAVQNSYGGPHELKKLVNRCHLEGIGVVLDVVYNHLGPEGNYFEDFAPYFSDRFRTFWGKAINFDDAYSSEVRSYFIQNALHWFENYHMDALRLDAVHAIFDTSAKHFLEELSERVGEFCKKRGKKHLLIAESDLNDVRIIRKQRLHGYGIDAQWCDDFHHSLHSLLTGEKNGYYEDFGKIDHLKATMKDGFFYTWKYSSYRKRYFGSSTGQCEARQFIVFSQNHDQVGNRMDGKRLSELVSFEALKLAAGTVLLSPFIPLLFMGEDYGEKSPFHYFVSHSDERLIHAVREGRKDEFAAFGYRENFQDPQDEKTFLLSKISWDRRDSGMHGVLADFYSQLLGLRKGTPALNTMNRNLTSVEGREEDKLLILRRDHTDGNVLCLFNFGKERTLWRGPEKRGCWRKLLDSAQERWLGPGSRAPSIFEGGQSVMISPLSFVAYTSADGE